MNLIRPGLLVCDDAFPSSSSVSLSLTSSFALISTIRIELQLSHDISVCLPWGLYSYTNALLRISCARTLHCM